MSIMSMSMSMNMSTSTYLQLPIVGRYSLYLPTFVI